MSSLQTSLTFERQATLPNADNHDTSTSIITPYLAHDRGLTNERNGHKDAILRESDLQKLVAEKTIFFIQHLTANWEKKTATAYVEHL